MAAPIFTQAEVNRMLAMPKHVEHDDWQGKWNSRDGSEGNVKLIAHPDDKTSHLEFFIERADRPSREEIAISLSVKTVGRERILLCRYDIQVNRHTNPKWFSPRFISARAPHKHVYNVRAVKEGTPSDWDKCASLIGISGSGSPQQLMERLTRVFVDELKISFYNPSEPMLFK